jgi:hypothetical protein
VQLFIARDTKQKGMPYTACLADNYFGVAAKTGLMVLMLSTPAGGTGLPFCDLGFFFGMTRMILSVV